jgi:BMFP domain-containing protein YqiC
LTDECFGNFMHAMHLRWRAHEQRVLNRRELVHDREKQDLYRQVSHRKPHDVTKLEARVRHLRGQLRSSSGGKAGTAAAAAGSSGGGGGAGAAARLGEHSTQQSKEKLLAWSLETVEQLAKNQAS